MKQSTLIIISSIVLILLIFLAGWVGYNQKKCSPQIDSPIIQQLDTLKWITIENLYKDSIRYYKSKLKLKPKTIIQYETLNRSNLCDSVAKYFGTIEIEL